MGIHHVHQSPRFGGPEFFQASGILMAKMTLGNDAMLNWFIKRLRGNKRVSTVVLREIREANDSRLLRATLTREGGLDITGIDRGDSVEQYFGEREYEWQWRLSPEATAEFHQALGVEGDLMTVLAQRFSGEAAGDLKTFLEEHHIAHKVWSRTGD